MILFKNIETASRVIAGGIGLKSIQLGGVPHTPDKKIILNAVSLGEKEIDLLKDLKENWGVDIELHITPAGDRYDYDKILKTYQGK